MLGLFDKTGVKNYWRGVIETYDELLYTKKTRNSSVLTTPVPSTQNKIGVDFKATYDGENITSYYVIQTYPEVLNNDYRTTLRMLCGNGVRLNFITKVDKHKIDWNSPRMTSKLKILKQKGEDNDNTDINAYNIHGSISTLDNQNRVEESLLYLSFSDKKRHRSMVKVSTLITISGVKGPEYDNTMIELEGRCESDGLKLTRILYDIPSVVRYFSPFYNSNDTKLKRIIPQQVMPDETFSRFSSYNQGTLGVRGITFGTDVYSNFPVFKVVKIKDDVAENWIITAETGGGKSHLVKDILLQLLAKNYNATVMDVEGMEYIPIAEFMANNSKVVVINMAEGQGKYFDSVEIPEESGNEEIDATRYKLSTDFTISVFRSLIDPKDLTSWVNNVINDAVSETYIRNGVTDDKRTWRNSENLTFHDVYNTFYELKREGFRDSNNYNEAIDLVIASLDKYFKTGGTKRDVFKERIRTADIINSELVICSFGMAGKSYTSIDPVQLTLMQLSAAQISHQRSIYSFRQGKFNVKIWEELQRWGDFPGADVTLGTAITGGRKLGDVNIAVTNNIGKMLDDDKFGIISNYTSFLIGAIADNEVREKLVTRMGIEHLKEELDLIATSKKPTDSVEGEVFEEDLLTYAFLCGLDRDKYGIVKVALPDDLAQSQLYKTGVSIQENVGGS